MTRPIIEIRNLHKWYSGVHALKDVSLDVLPNETLGLVGDNGAGKSTLINILSGTQQRTSGTITFEGRAIDFTSPRDAMEAGIETIEVLKKSDRPPVSDLNCPVLFSGL